MAAEGNDQVSTGQDLRIAIIVVTRLIDGLVQDCSNSSVLAMELLQSCTKPSICSLLHVDGSVQNCSTSRPDALEILQSVLC